MYQVLFAVVIYKDSVYSSCAKTCYPFFAAAAAARIPWRITQVPGYISVVVVVFSVAKLQRFGVLRFFCIANGIVHALTVAQCCTRVFNPSPVRQTLSDLNFGKNASLSNFCVCFSIIFSPV